MNTSLNNRKKLQNLLNTFIDSAVLDKELIEAICLGEINDDYVNHIKALLKKLSTLSSMQATSTTTWLHLTPRLWNSFSLSLKSWRLEHQWDWESSFWSKSRYWRSRRRTSALCRRMFWTSTGCLRNSLRIISQGYLTLNVDIHGDLQRVSRDHGQGLHEQLQNLPPINL